MRYLLSLMAVLTVASLSAQSPDWELMMRSPNPNLNEIEAAFRAWQAQDPEKRKAKPAQRWIEHMRLYAGPDGAINRDAELPEISRWAARGQASGVRNGNWQILGPRVPTNIGIGRVNAIAFHPTDANVMYAGSASGGLWRSDNAGLSWMLVNTGFNVPVGVSDIDFDPSNPDIIYVLTGDNDAQDVSSFGAIKSTDGGLTWTNIYPVNSSTFFLDELVVHPNGNILLMATNQGVWRSENAGANWTRVLSGSYEDISFKPNNPDVVYVCGYGSAAFHRSLNGGLTWSNVTNGLPPGGAAGQGSAEGRTMLGVTPANPEYVYLLMAEPGSGDYDFKGLYRSADGGQSWVARSTKATAQNVNFAQAWYDLALAVSPTQAERVFIGDVPLMRSLDGGTTWSRRDNTGNGLHVDIHDISFHPITGDLWVGCDGGVWRSPASNTGQTWEQRNNNLSITQFYRLGTSVHSAGNILAGSQDNGTMYFNNNSWSHFMGGDGMECLISYEDPNLMYASYQNGGVRHRAYNQWRDLIDPDITGESGAWVTPYIQDPTNPRTLYAGFQSLWRTENNRDWTKLSGVLASNNLRRIVVPQITQGYYIYATNGSNFYRSLDRGVSWETYNLPSFMNDFVAHPNQPQTLFGACNQGVFTSTNGGVTWTRMPGNLPNTPMLSIVYQHGSADALYVGSTAGIYYKDNTLPDWVSFANGLPLVEVTELEISYCTGKIRAATYGRGLWESDLYANGYMPPRVNIEVKPVPATGTYDLEAKIAGGFGPFTYQWNNSVTRAKNNGVMSGQYIVEIRDRNHCKSNEVVNLSPVSIDGGLQAPSFLLSPNPSSGTLAVQVSGLGAGAARLNISDLQGRTVFAHEWPAGPELRNADFDLSRLPAGVYLVVVTSGERRSVQRWLKL